MESEALAELTDKHKKRVLENLALVYKVHRNSFSTYWSWESDLIQEGIVGLIRAVINFDEDKGYQFLTYAYKSIYQTMVNYLNRYINNIVKVPAYRQDLYGKYIGLIKGGMSRREACDELNCDIDDMIKIESSRNVCSLNIKVGDEENTELIETYKDSNLEDFENTVINKLVVEDIKELFKSVHKDDDEVMKVFELWCVGMTDVDISKSLGYTIHTAKKARLKIEDGIKRVVKLYNSSNYIKIVNDGSITAEQINKILVLENVDEILDGYKDIVEASREWLLKNKGKKLNVNTLAKENNMKVEKNRNAEFKKAITYKLIQEGLNINVVGKRNELIHVQ